LLTPPSPSQLGAYIHVPFCRVHCPYCDFYTYPASRGRDGDFCRSLLRELALLDRRLEPGAYRVETVYFGGGTPSTLSPAQIGQLLSAIALRLHLSREPEVTLEANPEDVRPEALDAWMESGVNRVSLGVQSLQAQRLEFLGRVHTAQTARAALKLLSRHPNWSADLMFGWEGQTVADLASELDELLSYSPPHVSLYQLTLEPKTKFGVLAAQHRLRSADTDRQADLYLAACERLETAGVRQYEVSNFSRPGWESRHNSAYWERRSYVGLGPSAASFLAGRRTKNAASLARYTRALEAGFLPVEFVEVLDPDTVLLEELWLGLRTASGVRPACVEKSSDSVLENARAQGLLSTRPDGRIALTRKGMAVADELVRRLLPTGSVKIFARDI
jgi:putative oxygen-independent coproporphyrinogen III oxidase